MERSNEVIKKMLKNKGKYSVRYAEFYDRLAEESNLKHYKDKAIRLKSCFELQFWDKYQINKILDNRAHSVCRNRFCLNCQIMNNAKYAYSIKPVIDGLIAEGYGIYLLTLTVPNCNFDELDETLKKMNKAYNDLFKKFNAEDKRKWENRLLKIYGSLRVLEITVNNDERTFHPHFHVLLILDNPKYDEHAEKHLKNYIEGRYSYKLKDYNKFSNFGIQIMKMWTLLYNKKRITKKSYEDFTSNPKDPEVLEINLQPFVDEKGEPNYLELLKYTAKFDEVYSYEVFKYLELALRGKRRIQPSGILYDMIDYFDDEEDVNVGREEELILEYQEEPTKEITKKLSELIVGEKKEYRKLYRKGSRYDKDFYTKTIKNLS